MTELKENESSPNVTGGVENPDLPLGADLARRKTFEDNIKIKAKTKAKELNAKIMALEVREDE